MKVFITTVLAILALSILAIRITKTVSMKQNCTGYLKRAADANTVETAKEEIQKPHFSALNKGLNSGKPLLQPCPNCYKIETENGEFKEVLYWVSFTLCQAKAFHPCLPRV